MHGPECAHTHRHTAACVLLLYLFVRFYIKLDELSAEISDLLVLLLKIVEVICTTSEYKFQFQDHKTGRFRLGTT
ncbi:hypothetical protein ACOSQ4_001940 [Xanthoceras sorbifolium]